jgi:pimeloyl-ACP methyl ester carboxylesterase
MVSWLLRALGVLILLSALALAMSRAPDRPVQSLVQRWAPPPSDFIEVNGQIVHLRDEGPRGDPAPIVLLHGTSASLHTWEGWVKALKAQRRVITFDLPGFGLTGPFTGPYAGSDYSGDAYARFVLDVAEQLKLDRFVVGGNSLGGDVAWRVALMAPERARQLILVDSGGLPYVPEEFPLAWRIAKVPVLNRLVSEILPRSLVHRGLVTAYGDAKRVTPDLVDRYFELALREGNRAALVQRLRNLVAGADAERITKLRVPTLVIWGRRDRLIPPAAGEEFARRIPGSRLVIYDDLGHVPQEEDPERTVLPVRSFLGLS